VASRFGVSGLKTNTTTVEQITPTHYLQQNWKQWLNDGVAYFGVVGGGLALYMLSNKIFFGTFSPVSGQIKRWWGSLAGRVYDGPAADPLSFIGINYQTESNIWHPLSSLLGTWAEKWDKNYLAILIIFALLYYFFLFINLKKAKSAIAQLSLIPLFASAWLQVLYYHAQGYSAYKEWYWVAQVVCIVLALSLIPGMLYYALRKVPYAAQLAWIIPLLFAFNILPRYWANIRTNMTYGEWQTTEPNNDLAAFLEQHTEPGSIIGMTGGGNAGYFIHDRTVINMDGLINSNAYFKLLQSEQAGEYLANEGMDYILANSDLLNQLPYRGQFAPYIEWMDVRYGGKDLVRYHDP
jgi:hypothetical protein